MPDSGRGNAWPERSFDLQHELAEAGLEIPIIFLTGRGSIPMSVKAMKAGAVEFLTKPLDAEELLNAIQEAISGSRSEELETKNDSTGRCWGKSGF